MTLTATTLKKKDKIELFDMIFERENVKYSFSIYFIMVISNFKLNKVHCSIKCKTSLDDIYRHKSAEKNKLSDQLYI